MTLPGFTSERGLYRRRRSYRTRRVHNQVATDAVVPQVPLDSACCRYCAQSGLCCIDNPSYCWCVPCHSEAVVEQFNRHGY